MLRWKDYGFGGAEPSPPRGPIVCSGRSSKDALPASAILRPAHAKGLMCSGTFAQSAEAAELTLAPHARTSFTPVTVRYSDGTGVPNIPDNDPVHSGPRGIAIRFHLGDHAHTDIIAHSTNRFPVRTGEEFVEFLRPLAKLGV